MKNKLLQDDVNRLTDFNLESESKSKRYQEELKSVMFKLDSL